MKYLRRLVEWTDENYPTYGWGVLIVMTVVYTVVLWLARLWIEANT